MKDNMYDMIFKRKSFHLFRNIGEEKLTEAELQGIYDIYGKLDSLYPDIKTGIRIVKSDEKVLGRGAEYAIEIYSEQKENYLMNIGYIGEQLDLYLVSQNIGSLWFGIGKPEMPECNGMTFVIMILIAKVDCDGKFRKDMFKSKRMTAAEIWEGEQIEGLTDVVRFAPSACNSQPWRVKRSENELAVYRYRRPGKIGIMPANAVSFYNRIDMGIFLCFLEICMGHGKCQFTRTLYVDGGLDEEMTLNARYELI